MDGRWLDHEAEGLIVVHAMFLTEPADDPPSFMAGKGAVGVELVLEDPFARHDVGAKGMRNQHPSVIVDEGSVLLCHGCTPVGVC